MIQSFLDNDLYKFTMQQAVHMLYPRTQVEYEFTNRGKTPFPDGFASRLKTQVQKMASLSLSKEQKTYLEDTCYFLTPVYLDFLETYTYDPGEVSVHQDKGNFSLLVKGPWYRTMLWEVPLMALISETFFSMTAPCTLPLEKTKAINKSKAAILAENNVRFADFGTRRRFSSATHNMLIADILSNKNNTLIGTSNVHIAKKFNIKPIGTMAHEWVMFHAVLVGYKMANTLAKDAWIKVFKGDLGIVLTDTYTTDVFLSSFDTYNAKLFDGVRHDSGDPIAFINKVIHHYKKHHVDPTTKTIVFSDGLNIDKAVAIHNECKGKIRDSYGIGTNLTNDVGETPLNIVIKLSRCKTGPGKPWQHAVKLSDDKGKNTGNPSEVKTCMRILDIPEQ